MNRNLLKKLMRIATSDEPEVSPVQLEYNEAKRRATMLADRYRRETGKAPPQSGEDSCFPSDIHGRTIALRSHLTLLATELKKHHEQKASGQVFAAGAVLQAVQTICRRASEPVVTQGERGILAELQAEHVRLSEVRERNTTRAARLRFEDQLKAIGSAVDNAEDLPGYQSEPEIQEACRAVNQAARRSQSEIREKAMPIIREIVLRFESAAQTLIEIIEADYRDLMTRFPGLLINQDFSQVIANVITSVRTNAEVSSNTFSGKSPADHLRGIID